MWEQGMDSFIPLNNSHLFVIYKFILHFRVYPYLCRGVKNFVKDHAEIAVEKEYYLSLTDVPTRHKIRELTTQKIGTLVRISGQVGIEINSLLGLWLYLLWLIAHPFDW